MDRRDFLLKAGLAGGGALLAAPSLRGLVARGWLGARTGDDAGAWTGLRAGPGEGGYGQLRPKGPELALPDGFEYVAFGEEGSRMADGLPTPRAHDGMAAFPRPGDGVRLIRNHEDRSGPGEAPRTGPADVAYDPLAPGGCTALDVEIGPSGDPRLVEDRLVLNGTIVNCAGGPTPWGSWLTCEETTEGRRDGWEREHGYVFEVPADASGPVAGRPLRALGRFVHEAVAVDPRTSVLYLTEDEDRAGFYRFLPKTPGWLAEGGRLQMLAVDGDPRYDASRGQEVGRELPVRWVDVPEPDPPGADENPAAVLEQGLEAGGARFTRLEGCWHGDGSIYFHATDGGDAGLGQVWQYEPGPSREDGGVLRLVFESPSEDVLDSPDNITVSPRGGLVLCEDCRGPYVRGLTREGRIFDVARNLVNEREFAGACFSPDGRTLFVNIQGDTSVGGPGHPGMTFAIRGPWEDGAL